MALGTRTKFQLEILTMTEISVIVYFREIILESSRNVSETTLWSADSEVTSHVYYVWVLSVGIMRFRVCYRNWYRDWGQSGVPVTRYSHHIPKRSRGVCWDCQVTGDATLTDNRGINFYSIMVPQSWLNSRRFRRVQTGNCSEIVSNQQP